MKLIPILFSTPMVQANLEGRKTQTRRTKGLENISELATEIVRSDQWKKQGDWVARFKYKGEEKYAVTNVIKCPYGQVGDVLWVREKWTQNGLKYYRYAADWPNEVYISGEPKGTFIGEGVPEKFKGKWKPSIHMPKEACRLFLRITNIRVERLKDITDQDAIAEGIEGYFEKLFMEWRYRDYDKKLQKGYGKSNIDYPTWREPVSSFKSLWESINGKDSWEANPWVWVVEFEKLEGKPDGF